MDTRRITESDTNKHFRHFVKTTPVPVIRQTRNTKSPRVYPYTRGTGSSPVQVSTTVIRGPPDQKFRTCHVTRDPSDQKPRDLPCTSVRRWDGDISRPGDSHLSMASLRPLTHEVQKYRTPLGGLHDLTET